MEHEQSILVDMLAGIAILDCADLRICYANPYLISLLDEPWSARGAEGIIGRLVQEVLPAEIFTTIRPILQEVCLTGQSFNEFDIPYEGFLRARGRTYWNISLKLSSFDTAPLPDTQNAEERKTLLITIEDRTELARSRLYLNAIHYITSAIAGADALPQVLDRILESVHELVGSTRCAVLLIESAGSDAEYAFPQFEEHLYELVRPNPDRPSTIIIAAQKGMHLRVHSWRPPMSRELLIGHVVRDRHTFVMTDTSKYPDMKFPLLNDNGIARRPGSVLCVPIFEPAASLDAETSLTYHAKKRELLHTGTVIGAIEVYHRRARGFPAEEVELLEQFAQQAGLAIQNARLFRRINHLARDASRSARQQKNVMQAIPDGVIIYDSRWRVVDVNPVIRQLFGWSANVIGSSIAEAMAQSRAIFEGEQDGRRTVSDILAQLDLHAVERRIDEIKMIGADGKRYTMSRSYAPIHDDSGNIFAAVVVYHDVTEQTLARERIEAEVVARTTELAQRNIALQLAKAEQDLESAKMELLLERLPSGVMLISAKDMHLTLLNHRSIRLLQRIGRIPDMDDLAEATTYAESMGVEQLLGGLTVYSSSGPPVPFEEQPFALALYQGEANEAELHLKETDDQLLSVLISAAPLRDPDGTITDVLLVVHEITKLKTLERAREDFFTTMAHELKTPLANIRAYLSALLTSDLQWTAEEQRDFIETADEQVERLVRMINHFLDASRVEAGALRLQVEPILLPEMLEDLQERLEALIASSNRHLKIIASPLLLTVQADYELIMSVLINLLSNAFRYAPEGDTVQLEVKAVYQGTTTGIEFCVRDRGPGMSQEQQAELFTRFSTFAARRRPARERPGQPGQPEQPTTTQQHDNARWSPTTGLGLYISRGIIEAHGGKLTVESSPGEGATFSFTLAVAQPVKHEAG